MVSDFIDKNMFDTGRAQQIASIKMKQDNYWNMGGYTGLVKSLSSK